MERILPPPADLPRCTPFESLHNSHEEPMHAWCVCNVCNRSYRQHACNKDSCAHTPNSSIASAFWVPWSLFHKSGRYCCAGAHFWAVDARAAAAAVGRVRRYSAGVRDATGAVRYDASWPAAAAVGPDDGAAVGHFHIGRGQVHTHAHSHALTHTLTHTHAHAHAHTRIATARSRDGLQADHNIRQIASC